MRILWVLMCLIGLSGCGFHSLYRVQDNTTILTETEQIQILPIPNAEGYQMTLLLQTKLNPRQVTVPKTWALEVRLDDATYYDQSIQGDNFASLEKVTLTAHYTLKNLTTDEQVLSASTSASGSYNLIREAYATQMAKEKTKENLIQNLSDDIAMHLFAYLKGRPE